jgi:cholesterol transport system auxiliary component
MNRRFGEKSMHGAWPLLRPGTRALALATLVVMLAGCFGGGKEWHRYALDYAPAFPQGLAMLPETITVEPFTTAQIYRSTAMIFQEEPYQRDQYLQNSWRVSPADLVADCLLRDLRSSGMFRGVFHYRNAEPSRYLLSGSVEEFQEFYDKEGHRAVVSLNASLFDTSGKEFLDRLLFQKNYRFSEPLEEATPAGLAKGMSRAVAKVSGQLLADVYDAVRKAR